MTKFTKTANYIFRCIIAVAFALTVAALVSGNQIIQKALTGVDDAVEAVKSITDANLSGAIGMAKVVPLLLLLAVILSCVAFKCAGKAALIFRTLALLLTAGLSSLASFLLSAGGLFQKIALGNASSEEIESVKTITEQFATTDFKDAEAGACAIFGMVLLFVVAVILTILVITSVISIVKTVKASSDDTEL